MSRAVETSAELAATPEEIWSVVMDPHRLERWVTTHEGLEGEVPDRLEQGSTFAQRLKLGRSFTVTWEVVECDRPRRVRWEGRGPAGSRAQVSYELGSLGEARTRFTYQNRFELPGGALGRLAGRAVGDHLARREAERSLANLKTLVEG